MHPQPTSPTTTRFPTSVTVSAIPPPLPDRSAAALDRSRATALRSASGPGGGVLGERGYGYWQAPAGEASDEQRDAQRGAAAFAALGVRAGAAGRRGRAGLVFLGVRQGWAHVHTSAPRPLPGSNVTVTGQDLVPAASALAIAGLATLAAVIATRGLARRLAGGLLMLFGAGAAASVLWPISDATAIRAAASSAGLQRAGRVRHRRRLGHRGRFRRHRRDRADLRLPGQRGHERHSLARPGGRRRGAAGGGGSADDLAVRALAGHVQPVRAAAPAGPGEPRAAQYCLRRPSAHGARARDRVPADRTLAAGRRPQFGGHLGVTQPRRRPHQRPRGVSGTGRRAVVRVCEHGGAVITESK